jgi:hypothetical protein
MGAWRSRGEIAKGFRVCVRTSMIPGRHLAEFCLNSVWADAAVTESSLTLCCVTGWGWHPPAALYRYRSTVGYCFLWDVKVMEDGLGGPDAAGLSQPHNSDEENSNESEPESGPMSYSRGKWFGTWSTCGRGSIAVADLRASWSEAVGIGLGAHPIILRELNNPRFGSMLGVLFRGAKPCPCNDKQNI